MIDQFDNIIKKEKEFDEAVEEIFVIFKNESGQKNRNKKIKELIAKLKKSYVAAHYDAATDALTGCYNKKHIKEMYQHQYAYAKRNNQFFSLAVIDIDYLKYINDTYGHGIGDEAIQKIAKNVVKSVRENDLIFRYGGDEFVILSLHNKQEGMKKVSDRIHKEIAKMKLGVSYTPSVTIGYTTIKPTEKDNIAYSELFKKADEMLYQRKHSRKAPDYFKKQ